MGPMVGIEILPIGSSVDKCEGAVVRLIQDDGDSKSKDGPSLSAALSGPQCREIARRLMVIADAAARDEMTIMCISKNNMWDLPGQVLLVRKTPDGIRFEFAVKTQEKAGGLQTLKKDLVIGKRRGLIVP